MLRIIFIRPGYFRKNLGGILQSCGSQNSYYVTQTLSFQFHKNSVFKCSTVRHYSDFQGSKQTVKVPYFIKPLPGGGNTKNLTEGALLNQFHKILNYHKKNKRFPDYDFLKSNLFKDLVSAINKKLPYLSPSALLCLLEIEQLDTPASSTLMRKLFALILDNINGYSFPEKLDLYMKLNAEEYRGIKECQDLLKVLDAYFAENFSCGLQFCKSANHLLKLLEVEKLPAKYKSVVANRLMCDVLTSNCSGKEMMDFVVLLCKSAYTLVPKNDTFELIKRCLYGFHGSKIVLNISQAYRILIHNDESYYNEEIINLFINLSFHKLPHPKIKLLLASNVCSIGYLDYQLLESMAALCLSINIVDAAVFVLVSNIFACTSYHETAEEKMVRSLRKVFESFALKMRRFTPEEICMSCSNLTYLGCDTRAYYRKVCSVVSKSLQFSKLDTDLLCLHNFIKASNLTGYEDLSESLLNRLLKWECRKFESFSPEILSPVLESKHLLKGCKGSNSHLLHFVSLFGPDNKPMDLSRYIEKQSKIPIGQHFSIEEIERPAGSKLVAFQIFYDTAPLKFKNSPILSGTAKMYLKSFEPVDCSVVLLPPKYFRLPQEAKEEYLKTEINEVLKKLESSKSTVQQSVGEQ